MDPFTIIVTIIILIMSVVLHELSHGYVAEFLGDPTPRNQGRLTVNPLRHMEMFGSVIVPFITSLVGFTFGWAKPVQWNPYNVKNRRVGEFLISIAGPMSNIFIAIIFGLIIRFGVGSSAFVGISAYIVIINITLAIFNLIPIPPLDGSKVLFSMLPQSLIHIREAIERYSIVLILILIFFLWQYFSPLIPLFFRLITGVNLGG